MLMNKSFAVFFWLLSLLTMIPPALAAELPVGDQTSIGLIPPGQKKPMVIIYTLSTCPHCLAAKSYFIENNIAFVNREVDSDSENMSELIFIYDKMNVPENQRGVPLILIGDDIKLQGFNKEKVQEALKKAAPK